MSGAATTRVKAWSCNGCTSAYVRAGGWGRCGHPALPTPFAARGRDLDEAALQAAPGWCPRTTAPAAQAGQGCEFLARALDHTVAAVLADQRSTSDSLLILADAYTEPGLDDRRPAAERLLWHAAAERLRRAAPAFANRSLQGAACA